MTGEQEKSPRLRLKNLRYKLGLSIRDVVTASREITQRTGDRRYFFSASQLADLENHGRVPGIHKISSLSKIYDRPIQEILRLMGVEVDKEPEYRRDTAILATHPVDFTGSRRSIEVPLRFDPAFSRKATTLLNRVIQDWGILPFEFFNRLEFQKFLYVLIGLNDNLMHPILRPGSIVKVDVSQKEVRAVDWRHEQDRPIFLVEAPSGWRCSWCLVEGRSLILVPHPLSLKPQERYLLRTEAEIVGRAVGGWMSFMSDDGE